MSYQSFGLLFCIGVSIATSALADPPPAKYAPHEFARSWKAQAREAASGKEYDKARDLYLKWTQADPADADGWYGLAGCYARLNDKEKALDAFECAVDAGYRDLLQVEIDADFNSIQNEARFKDAVARISDKGTTSGPAGFIRRFARMQTIGTYIVMLPPDYQTSKKDYPVCVILHGNGSSETDHGALADYFGRDDVIYVAVRAPHPRVDLMVLGMKGWSATFPENIPADDPAFNQNRMDYAQWIFDAVKDARAHYRIKPGKFFIFGHSQGGQFAMACALVHPEQVASIFVEAGSLPKEPFVTQENLAKMKAEKVRVTMIHGEADPMVSPADSKLMNETFQKAGIPCTLQMIPGGHLVSQESIKLTRAWLDAEVRPKKAD